MGTVAVIAMEHGTRQRLTALLEGEWITVVTECSDPVDLPVGPDAVVVACSGADPTPQLALAAASVPGSALVAVLPVVTRHAVRRALRAGAAGVVREGDVDCALAIAIQAALAGQLSIPFAVADGLEKPVLSSREKQVLGMVVMGFTNNQIALRLFLAESTVKCHLSSIFAKLGVASRKEAAALILDPEEGLGMGILGISAAAPAGPAVVAERAETAA